MIIKNKKRGGWMILPRQCTLWPKNYGLRGWLFELHGTHLQMLSLNLMRLNILLNFLFPISGATSTFYVKNVEVSVLQEAIQRLSQKQDGKKKTKISTRDQANNTTNCCLLHLHLRRVPGTGKNGKTEYKNNRSKVNPYEPHVMHRSMGLYGDKWSQTSISWD